MSRNPKNDKPHPTKLLGFLYSTSDSPQLLDQIRTTFRLQHYSPKTEKSYPYYIKDFLQYHGMRPPNELGVQEIRKSLSHLAVEKYVAASAQNIALSSKIVSIKEKDFLKLQRRPLS